MTPDEVSPLWGAVVTAIFLLFAGAVAAGQSYLAARRLSRLHAEYEERKAKYLQQYPESGA